MRFFIIISFLLMYSCGANKNMNFQDISTENTDITGEYRNNLNILSLLNRKLLKDTLDTNIVYEKFKISFDKNKMNISVFQNDVEKINRQYRYKYQNGVYYLKNQNVKPLLIPFIFGSIDEKRLYFYKNKKGNLKINVYESRTGAVFFVGFLDGKSRTYFEEYEYIR